MKEFLPMDNNKPNEEGCACTTGSTDAQCDCDHNASDSACECSDDTAGNDTINDEACCGPPMAPASSPSERPGYKLCGFVDGFLETAAGPVPKIKTELGFSDHAGGIGVRCRLNRNNYKVAPGLYAVGNPGKDSHVLVTANYKLTFDAVRSELKSLDVWVLVLDTRGVNVWCAAGKKTFGTDELISRVKTVQLEKVVNHKKLILPQLGAVGVSGHIVKKGCGFRVVWGPVRAKDIKKILDHGLKSSGEMRNVTFTMNERIILISVELSGIWKISLWFLLAAFALSGIGFEIYSFNSAWNRGVMITFAYFTGLIAGAAAVPALLPWIPGRAFSLKGAITGLIGISLVVLFFRGQLHMLEIMSMALLSMAVSSWLGMNFTGSSPYTSPSGVEKEMRKAMPLQAASVVIAAVCWIWAAFI